ncbi:hypothetical protein MPSI1_000863 [Malassezia psittaci]|uniref:USP domain-containing protein n=1 Tax=Malassezia psittaci TaxID=1821823 RepID=A0AAF0JCR0_9BASI|nr:hypothetical protein MPSI1_000863 [Malassezia psittaci]
MPRPSVAALHAELCSSSADASASALYKLRDALRVHQSDLSEYAAVRIAVTDERLNLAREVIESEPRVLPLIFDAWEVAEQRSLSTLKPVPIQLLAQLLDLVSSHQPFHALGERLVNELLSTAAPWMQRMLKYLQMASTSKRDKRDNSKDTVAALVSLRLLTSMATFARGKYSLATWEQFHWTSEMHARLLSMRRRARTDSTVSLFNADIRTQYIMFLNAMLIQSYHTTLKVALLELGQDCIPLVFRGLVSDPGEVVQYVLVVLHEEVFKESHIPRGTKVKLLQDQACASLIRLYSREKDVVKGSTSVADIVHHFFLSIGTHPGFGICYKDRGWYPRLEEGSATTHAIPSTGIYNKILAALLRQLSPTSDLRQQELALRILHACPELVSSYLNTAQRKLPVEAQLDSTWLSSMAFFGRIMALPIPNCDLPTPPPLNSLLANTIPDALLRALGRGLRHSNKLVQYFTSLVVVRILQRIQAVGDMARNAADQLGESAKGPWRSVLQSLELSCRKIVPSIETLLPLVKEEGSMRQEAALRALALYHTVLPSMTFDTRYDVSKLLTSAFLDTKTQYALRLDQLCQLHALQIVANSTEMAFDLSAKASAAWPGHALRSNLHFILSLYASTSGIVQSRARDLLFYQLSKTTVFAHDTSEIQAWLITLPLPDEGLSSVLNFVDDCWQRCLKTPHRYAERARSHFNRNTSKLDINGAPFASPLLMTIVEQARIRLSKKLFDTAQGAEANASAPIVAYIVRVLLHFVADAKPYHALCDLLDELDHAGTSNDSTRRVFLTGKTLLQSVRQATACDATEVRYTALSNVDEKLVDAQDSLADMEDKDSIMTDWLASITVLQSRHEDYPNLVHRIKNRAWKMLFIVILERLEHTSKQEVTQAFQTLRMWCKTYELSPNDLLKYVLERSVVKAWLAKESANPAAAMFRLSIVSLVCEMGSGRREYDKCFAILVENISLKWDEKVHDTALLQCAEQLAYATPQTTPIVHALLGSVSQTDNKSKYLKCLAKYAAAGTRFGAAETLHVLYEAMPSLIKLLPSPMSVNLLAEITRSALLRGLDALDPTASGTLSSLQMVSRHDLKHAAVALGEYRGSEADVMLMRCLYARPQIVSSVLETCNLHMAERVVVFPYTSLAIIELHELGEDIDSKYPEFANAVMEVSLEAIKSQTKSIESQCICLALLSKQVALRGRIQSELPKIFQGLQSVAFRHHLVWLTVQLNSPSLNTCVTEIGLRAIVQAYANTNPILQPLRDTIRAFTAFLLRAVQAESTLAEPVVEAVIQHRLLDKDAIRLARILLNIAPLRSGSYALRLLNACMANTEVVAEAKKSSSSVRSELVLLITALARSATDALSSPTTLARLVYLYRGSISRDDRSLFKLLRGHEKLGQISVLDVMRCWISDPKLMPNSMQRESLLDALLSLNPQRMHKTCVEFPRTSQASSPGADLYDPWFILNLVGGIILEREMKSEVSVDTSQTSAAPLTGLEWLSVLRTGSIGVVVCALSSHDDRLRSFAQGLLGKIYASLLPTEFRERDLLLLILERIRDAIPPPPPTSVTGSYDEVPWLPTIITLFMANCLRAVGAPQITLFPSFCRFLLQRPKLDVHDVPLLYNLLHSTSDQLHHERSWLLRFLGDSVVAHARLADARALEARRRTRIDWRIFQRRHVWDLLLSLYDALMYNSSSAQSAASIADTRDIVQLESIFTSVARIPYLASTLVTRRGFLQWVAMQIDRGAGGKYWLELLANLMGIQLSRQDRLRHLEEIDRALEGTIVLQALSCTAKALPNGMQVEEVQVACRLLHSMLEFAVLREVPKYHSSETEIVIQLLELMSTSTFDTTLKNLRLQCILYGTQLSTDRTVHSRLKRLFERHLGESINSHVHGPTADLELGSNTLASQDNDLGSSSHIGLHLAEEEHEFACDMVHGTLFCLACDDVIYDPRFEYVRQVEQRRSDVRRPDEKALDMMAAQDALCTPHTTHTAPQGHRLESICKVPRGLRNMGATCFLNVILQSFLHNPLLRNYFLSDRHNATLCAVGKDCLACEMDKLYAEFFARPDKTGPYGPTSFLYAIWLDSSSAELSQTGQHDAQEMFISALNGIHGALTQHAQGRTQLPHFPLDDPDVNQQLYDRSDRRSDGYIHAHQDHGAGCPCVVHRTFCGVLQSSVTCLRCGKVTLTRDPFLDLSLDVRNDEASETNLIDDSVLSKKKTAKKDEKNKKARAQGTPSLPEAQAQSLHACLVRYCSPEQLGEASYRCSECQNSARAVKQLALLSLPPVLCIQLKRYEHAASATKVDSRVQFPLTMDVRDCCVDNDEQNRHFDPNAYLYDLFTVVVHEGTLSSGHYTNFSRWKNQWYRFDDDKVSPAIISQVLSAKAYQLFYIRRTLYNQASHGIHTKN